MGNNNISYHVPGAFEVTLSELNTMEFLALQKGFLKGWYFAKCFHLEKALGCVTETSRASFSGRLVIFLQVQNQLTRVEDKTKGRLNSLRGGYLVGKHHQKQLSLSPDAPPGSVDFTWHIYSC